MILLFTPNNLASKNIAEKLICTKQFLAQSPSKWIHQLTKTILLKVDSPSVLDIPTDFDTDCIIVLSTHRSNTTGKMLTAHVPGNWSNADMGGQAKTLVNSPAAYLKIFAQEMKKQADKIGWAFSLEADHHGPTCRVPIIYVELGSNEELWGNLEAAQAVADALISAIMRISKGEKFETVIGFGGGHYPRVFTKIELEDPVLAIGHIAPKYAIDSIDEAMFAQAIEKNDHKPTRILLLKDEMNAKQREKLIEFAERFGLKYVLL